MRRSEAIDAPMAKQIAAGQTNGQTYSIHDVTYIARVYPMRVLCLAIAKHMYFPGVILEFDLVMSALICNFVFRKIVASYKFAKYDHSAR